jgi:hypothetical protein
VVTGKIPPIGIVDEDVLLKLGGPVGEKVNTDPSPFVTVIGVVTAVGIVNPSPELEITVSPAGSVVVIIPGGPNNKVGLKLPVGENVKTEPLPLIRVIGVVTTIGILASGSNQGNSSPG